jgi:hypothetical protein
MLRDGWKHGVLAPRYLRERYHSGGVLTLVARQQFRENKAVLGAFFQANAASPRADNVYDAPHKRYHLLHVALQ